MNIEEAIRHFEAQAQCYYPPTRKAAELAIAALRSQQSSAKLDRNRWKGCQYCKDIPTSILKGFCYVCGRPLTEEAWAELERRINGGRNDGMQ